MATKSNLLSPPAVYAAQIGGSCEQVHWTRLELFEEEDDAAESGDREAAWRALIKQLSTTMETRLVVANANLDWEAVLVQKKKKEQTISSSESGANPSDPEPHPPCRPLLLMPHGGPHGSHTTSFNAALASLLCAGHDLLLVNYRGSVGFGEAPLQQLPGHVGELDVADCLAALAAARGAEGPAAVVGGSHGGFLTAHLVSQAPRGTFFAGVLRNPVLDLGLMSQISDIPDWCFVEAWGAEEGVARARVKPTPEDYARFHAASPASIIDRVSAPLLFCLGGKDRRVVLRDAEQYIHALAATHGAQAPEVKTLVFPEDNHALDGVQTEFEQWFSAMAWLRKHMPGSTGQE